MHPFTDSAGRTWILSMNVGAIRRVKAQLGIDLLTVLDHDCQLFARLGADIALAVDLVWVLIADQAEKMGVTDEQFGESLVGDAIDRAMEALVAETIAFFPQGRRAILAKLWEKSKQATNTAVQLAVTKLDSLTTQAMEQEIERAFDRVAVPGSSSGAPPASAESTPSASACGS